MPAPTPTPTPTAPTRQSLLHVFSHPALTKLTRNAA